MPGSFEQVVLLAPTPETAARLSDHCPISVRIDPGGSPGTLESNATSPMDILKGRIRTIVQALGLLDAPE